MERYNSSSLLLGEQGRAAGGDEYDEDGDGDRDFELQMETRSTGLGEHEAGEGSRKSSEIERASAQLSIHIHGERLEDEPPQERTHETEDEQNTGDLLTSDEAVPLDGSNSSDKAMTETPLPLGKMIPIMLLTASESFNSSAIFSYVGYLVLDFNLTDDKKELGNYAGAISSCFFVAQFISSFFWGKMSDKYGRRPILLCGAVGTIISALLFGFSMNFPFAVFSRALCGLLNGNIGVVKTYLGEVTDSTNQTRAWSWFSLAAGAGAVVGALAGGLLAQPATKYPKLFSAGHGLFNGLFEEFPYLLPNVMAVLVCGTGLVLSYFYLTENKIPQRAVEVERETYGPLELDEESPEGVALELDDDADFVSSVEMKVVHSPDWRMKSEIASKETEDQRRRGGGDDEEEQDQRELHHPQAADDQGRNAGANHVAAAEEKSLRLTGEQESTLTDKVDGEGEGALSSLRSVLRLHVPWSSRRSSKAKKEKSVLLEGQVILSTSLYGLTGMLFIFIDAVFPLWTMTDPKEGGLGFTTDEIGITSSVGSLSIVVIQLGLYGPMARRLGLINTFKWGTLAAVPIFVAFPLVNYFHPDVSAWSSMFLMWSFIILIYIVRTFVGQLMFCAVMNLINNSVDVYNMGAANGLGQSLVALLRAIGPYFSSVMFAWSMTSGMVFPFNFYFVFVLMSVITVFILGLSFLLQPSLNTPKLMPTAIIPPSSAPSGGTTTKRLLVK